MHVIRIGMPVAQASSWSWTQEGIDALKETDGLFEIIGSPAVDDALSDSVLTNFEVGGISVSYFLGEEVRHGIETDGFAEFCNEGFRGKSNRLFFQRMPLANVRHRRGFHYLFVGIDHDTRRRDCGNKRGSHRR